MSEKMGGCIPIKDGHICIGAMNPPTKDRECPEVINSNGCACRKCPNDSCYRQGWLKNQVDIDNNKRFLEKRNL